MTNIFFQFIDSCSNPLTGSRVLLKPWNGPYISGSCFAYTGPSIQFSDSITGVATFSSVVAGIYKVSFSNAGALLMANGTYQNFDNTIIYIGVPETNGSTHNGMDFLLTNTSNTTNPNTFAFTESSSLALFMQKNPNTASSLILWDTVNSSYEALTSVGGILTLTPTNIGTPALQVFSVSSSYAATASLLLGSVQSASHALSASYLSGKQYTISSDNGTITSDGSGDLTIGGTLSVTGLTSLDNGTITTSGAGDITNIGNISATNNITAAYFVGNGSQLTNINGGQVSTVATATSASYANTSSWAINSKSASFTKTSISSSYLSGSQAYINSDGGYISSNGIGYLKMVEAIISDTSGNNQTTTIARYNNLTSLIDSVGSNYILNISSSGNVGIGTTAPLSSLHIETTTNIASIRLGSINNTLYDSAIQNRFLSNTGSYMDLGDYYGSTNFSPILTVSPLGFVGIGTTNPSAKLHILAPNNLGVGVTNDLLFTYNSAGNWRNSISNNFHGTDPAFNQMQFLVSNATVSGSIPVMTLVGNGNVGINTAVPETPLHVFGGASTTLQFMFGQGLGANERGLYGGYAYDSDYSWLQSTHQNVGYTPLVLQRDGGFVGIGNTTPSSSLFVKVTSGDGVTGGIGMQYAGNSGGNWLLTPYISGVSNGGFALFDKLNSVTPFVISDTNNIGIRTTSPAAYLDVGGNTPTHLQSVFARGGSDPSFRLVAYNGSGSAVSTEHAWFGMDYIGLGQLAGLSFKRGTSANATLNIQSGTGVNVITVGIEGNPNVVGINTTTPTVPLQVNGTISCSVIVAGQGAQIGGIDAGVPAITTTMVGYGQNNGNINTNATIIGYGAGLYATTSSNATLIGTSAGGNTTNANQATIVGVYAGLNAINANQATMVGCYAGQNSITTNNATLVGYAAGYNSTIGYYSTILGSYAGFNLPTASHATIIGYAAGEYTTDATNAVIIGSVAGNLSTKADDATIIGYAAGYNATTASNATLVGFAAGYTSTNATNCTFIGCGADTLTSASAQESIAIGYNARVSGSNQCVIGGTGADAVKVSIGGNSAVNTLDVVGNISCSVITASLLQGTSSYANNATSASNSVLAISSSWASASLSASFAKTSISSSYSTGSVIGYGGVVSLYIITSASYSALGSNTGSGIIYFIQN